MSTTTHTKWVAIAQNGARTFYTIAPADGVGDAVAIGVAPKAAPVIAAAPEMLAALIEVEAMIEAIIAARPMAAAALYGTTTLGNHRVAVRAAIAKAKGGAS